MLFGLISWQAIIAGVITALAISIVMTLLGMALGFSVVKPTSDEPMSGLGVTFGLWSVLAVVVSLAAGGLVAGAFTGIRGFEHGFMVWATVLIVGAFFGSHAISAAVRGVGSAVRGVGSGAASIASSVGSGVASVASSVGDSLSGVAGNAVERLKDSVDLQVDYDDLGQEVTSVLRDTGVESLQPEFIKTQMREAKADLKDSLHQLTMSTENYEGILSEFVDKQKARLDTITRNVDRDAAVTALMTHRNIPRNEAEKMVDNALNSFQKMVVRAKTSLNNAHEKFHEAKEHLRVMTVRAREKAERATSTAARSALAAALALIIGAFVCCYAGIYGGRYYDRMMADNTIRGLVTVERTVGTADRWNTVEDADSFRGE